MGTSEQKLHEMGAGRIFPLILKYAWPAVVTMTINQLYNVVDRVYIGHGCGPDAIAGLTLTFPIMGALGAVGVLIGMGSSTILSIRLGAGDRSGAEKALGTCVAMKLLFGLIVPPLMFFFGFRPILALMAGNGTTAETLHLAHQYLGIVIFFNIFAHLGFGLSATMRAEGSPRQSMYCMITGCATNMVLDPIFIFDTIPIPGTGLAIPGLGLRVAGAAWATNISMMVTCGTALRFYLRKKSVVRLRLARIGFFKGITVKALSIGLSPCLMQIMGAIIGFSLNHAFAAWSETPEQGTIQISAFGIANTMSFLFFIPCIGVQQGLSPIIGYNWGAGNYRRVKDCLILGLKLTAVATFTVFLGTELLPRIFARAFADDLNVIAATVKALRISNIFIWTIFVNIAATTYFQATGQPLTAILLSLLRQFLCLLPLVWTLPYLIGDLLGDHILAVWIALPISDIVAQLATIPPLLREFRRLNARLVAV
jgi:putative MATE family efflux protein